MKTRLVSASLFVLIAVLFTSCDPNSIDGSSNYWNSNTLTRLQLNGKVKTLTTSEGTQVSNFNQAGFITSQVYTTTSGTSTTTYNYASTGELTSTDFTSNMSGATSYSTTYTYQNTDKFIVVFPFPEHLIMNGLVPNLSSSAVSGTYGNNVTYSFSGDLLKIITISSSYKDTAYVTYSGKYPVSMSHGGSYANNITFASNGMFKTVTSGYQGSSNTTTNYFKSESKFLLTDSIVSNYGSEHYFQKYSYDSNKNVTRVVYSDGTKYDYTYVFDSQGNWTSKTQTISGTSIGSSLETRSITYW